MKAEALRPGFSSFKATFRLDIDSFPFNPPLEHCKAKLSDKGQKTAKSAYLSKNMNHSYPLQTYFL
ncbi:MULTISPECIES: hypothetical protein [Bacteroides]|uniref:Uncharacterized protein n=1 Tax=Bacteroides acidifaciens TaxID=85831 RepID=A0A4S2B403_9BACE|nr:hypothetical protein [Bacteroides acidifaciens]MBF0729993.1 hypothetical protein [Bacteroides acidifaciens]MBF0837004.1 hypothetical protein [Bacteroides acidifaciens]NDO53052.1 hypothetical protein [Bacteroides acidifaciens]TFU49256.1 hypothetical protein E4T97_10785 [Bacteroides acidifaciens]TGY08818.1 hypothetical protein E5356_00895 [Bacteroides acidifaciens]